MIEFNGKEFDGRRTHHLMAVSTLGGDILIALPILVAETKHFIRNWETGVLPRVDFFPQLEGSICQNNAKMVPKVLEMDFSHLRGKHVPSPLLPTPPHLRFVETLIILHETVDNDKI